MVAHNARARRFFGQNSNRRRSCNSYSGRMVVGEVAGTCGRVSRCTEWRMAVPRVAPSANNQTIDRRHRAHTCGTEKNIHRIYERTSLTHAARIDRTRIAIAVFDKWRWREFISRNLHTMRHLFFSQRQDKTALLKSSVITGAWYFFAKTYWLWDSGCANTCRKLLTT